MSGPRRYPEATRSWGVGEAESLASSLSKAERSTEIQDVCVCGDVDGSAEGIGWRSSQWRIKVNQEISAFPESIAYDINFRGAINDLQHPKVTTTAVKTTQRRNITYHSKQN